MNPTFSRGMPAPCAEGIGTEGMNDFRTVGYGGPCPPRGPAHRYVFRLYALRSPLPLPAGSDRRAFEAALKGRVLRVATLVGRYRR